MTIFRKCSSCLAGSALAALLLVLPGLASATTYYVSTTGDDTTGDGSAGNPWQTITHAAANVPAGTAVSPNEISVEAGLYNIGSGETFPIVFANNFVSLTGADSATTTINAGGSDALDVDAKGFAVSGFTFQNASDAIDISEGGFTISDNVFDTGVGQGVYFYRSDTDRTTGISFADMAITGNTFRTSADGIYVHLYHDFDSAVEGLSATFGNFTVTGNTFELPSGNGIDLTELFHTNEITNGAVTVGNLTVTGNTITGGSQGIYFWSKLNEMDDAQVTIGNITVSNNTCINQSEYGIYLYNWELYYFYGSTHSVLGDFTVSGNTVTATDYATYSATNGIYLDYMDDIGDIYDETTIATGSISVTNNTVDVDDYGIYFYSYGIWYIGEEYWGDSVAVTTGSRTISGNTIKSNASYGLYMDMEYIGYDMYGTSTVNYGNITVSNNTITSYFDAFYFYPWDEGGIYMYENSSATLGSITINGNSLTSTNGNAFYYYLYECGYDMNGNSKVTVGATSIANNTMNAGSGYGMYFYFYEIAYSMYDDASLTIGNFTIDNNVVNATGNDGIDIEYEDYYVGYDINDNASATLPDWIITDNTIDTTGGYGMYFYTYENPYDIYDHATVHYGDMLIDNNTFNPNKDAGMSYGIYLYFEEVDYYAYGPTVTTFGDITVTDNTFYSMESEAVYIEYSDVGYDFTGAPTLTMGDIEIGNNTVDAAPVGIDVYLDGLYADERASVTIGGLNIHDNTLTNISEYGIYAYYSNTNDEPGGATLTIGAPTISGNTVSGTAATDDGIYLYVDNATDSISFGMPVLSGNTVSGFNHGINVDTLNRVDKASLSCNFLENNILAGMRFGSSAGTDLTVKTNSFETNTVGLLVANGNATVINAERNWWGDVAGPVACASCNGVDPGDSGTVDFTPWLTFEPDKARCGRPFPWLMFVPAITGMGK